MGRQGGSGELRGQLFHADGVKRGVEFTVNGTTANTQETPQIAVLKDGRFVVAWVDDSGADGEADWGIRARVFNADGTAEGADFRVNTTTLQNQVELSITATANGGFVATYSNTDATTYSNVRARVYGADLQPVGASDTLVATDAGKLQFVSQVTGLDHGYAVVFAQQDTLNSEVVLRGRIFGDDGTGATEFAIADVPGGFIVGQTLTRLTDGRFVVVWDEEAADGSHAVKARIYMHDGTASGSAIAITAMETTFQFAVTALSGGGFAVTYSDPNASAVRWDIHAALFDGAGHRIGVDTIISPTDVDGAKSLSSLATLADGRLIATWLDESGRVSDPVGISGQILEVRTAAISLSGTSANDDYVGSEFNDVLGGAAGADTLDGAGGNDFLEGGAGAELAHRRCGRRHFEWRRRFRHAGGWRRRRHLYRAKPRRYRQ